MTPGQTTLSYGGRIQDSGFPVWSEKRTDCKVIKRTCSWLSECSIT